MIDAEQSLREIALLRAVKKDARDVAVERRPKAEPCERFVVKAWN